MYRNGVRYALLSLLLAACGEGSQVPGGPAGPEEPGPTPAPVPGVVASAPVARALLGQAGSETVAFVAAPNGTVARGRAAAVVNRRTGARVDAVVEEGGFDPVALVADDGDVVEVTLTDSAGQVTTTPLAVKRGTKPRVVRTAPEPRATDVPLNSVIRVVFSTPVRASAAAGAIRLFSGGVEVAGAVRVNGDADVVVDFEPAVRLAANADYELRVDAGLRDVLGEVLETAVAVPFTTGTTIAAATAVGIQLGRYGTIPGFALSIGDSVELVAYAYGPRRVPIRQEIEWGVSSLEVLRLRVPAQRPAELSGVRAGVTGISVGASAVTAAAGAVASSVQLSVIAESMGLSPTSRLKEVVFSDYSDSSLYAMRADGTGLTRLTNAARYPQLQPNVGRDGRIVFVAHWGDSLGTLGVRERDGTVRLLVLPSTASWPSCPVWSPDMRYLAFRQRHGAISIVYADSTEREALRVPGEGHGCPSWSPDGTRLSFRADVSANPGFGETSLFTLASGSFTTLTSDIANSGRWAGDGNALLSVYNIYVGNMFESVDIRGTVVQVIDASDGSTRTIWSGRPIVAHGVSDWSEDGRLALIPEHVWNLSGAHRARIWFIDGGWDDGRGWTAFLAPQFGHDPAFVPSGVSFTR